jgi:hypothetical protein
MTYDQLTRKLEAQVRDIQHTLAQLSTAQSKEMEVNIRKMTLAEVDAALLQVPASPTSDRDLTLRSQLMQRRGEILNAMDGDYYSAFVNRQGPFAGVPRHVHLPDGPLPTGVVRGNHVEWR